MISRLAILGLLAGVPVLPAHGDSLTSPRDSIAPTAGPPSRRDIVLIVTDDQPWHELDHMPLTNALIGDRGVRFTNAFASTPLCGPSRASILTGLYAHHHGVHGNGRPAGGVTAFHDASTLATWLSDVGYRTGLFGKYMNNYGKLRAPAIPPGWWRWFAFKTDIAYYDWEAVDDGTVVSFAGTDPNAYATNVIADRAVEFIETTPRPKPLFLLFTPSAPHGPHKAQIEDKGHVEGLVPYRPANFNEVDVSDKPAWVRALPLVKESAMDRDQKKQVETLQSVDRAVSRLVDALDRTGRLSNAVIIFVSDNGYSLGSTRWETKQCVYEDCARISLLIRAPGVAPRIDEHLVSNVDLAPSIAEWANTTPGLSTDGTSLVSLLANPVAPWRAAILLELLAPAGGISIPGFSAVRTRDWKYVELDTGERELYDLSADSRELQNRAGDSLYGGVRESLALLLRDLR